MDNTIVREPEIYIARWSPASAIGGIVLLGGTTSYFSVEMLMSGHIIFGLSALGTIFALSIFSLLSARAKYVAVTPTNLEIVKGIWTQEIVTVPLEKIDKITVSVGSVRVSAGSVLNSVNLDVQDPQQLKARLEKARIELSQKSRPRDASDQLVITPLLAKVIEDKTAAQLTREQVVGSWLVIGIIAATILGFSRCSSEKRSAAVETTTEPITVEVTRKEYGDRWPFTRFETGKLGCISDAVTIRLGSTTYGLNGTAKSRFGYPDPLPLVRREPGTESVSADGLGLVAEGGSISKFIQIGLEICRKN